MKIVSPSEMKPHEQGCCFRPILVFLHKGNPYIVSQQCFQDQTGRLLNLFALVGEWRRYEGN